MRILLVEDDPALSLGVARGLEREGWQVDVLGDGEQAMSEGVMGQYDLGILDLGLPRRDGMEVLRHWRAKGARMPVLLLTARDDLADRVQGLDAGADDYLVKPFDLPELLARIRALKRRAQGRVDDAIRTPDGRHVVMLDWIFSGLFGLVEAQVVQEHLDEVVIRIVAGPEFGHRDEHALMLRARERLGQQVIIRIERVAEIPRTRNGKFRQIVSRLSGSEEANV